MMFGSIGWVFRLSLDFLLRAFIHALLSRVILASARLSCSTITANKDRHLGLLPVPVLTDP